MKEVDSAFDNEMDWIDESSLVNGEYQRAYRLVVHYGPEQNMDFVVGRSERWMSGNTFLTKSRYVVIHDHDGSHSLQREDVSFALYVVFEMLWEAWIKKHGKSPWSFR